MQVFFNKREEPILIEALKYYIANAQTTDKTAIIAVLLSRCIKCQQLQCYKAKKNRQQ